MILKKILNNILVIESDLNALNFIISNDYETVISKIDFLYKENKKCFKSIYILAAVRNIKNKYYLIDKQLKIINQIIDS